MSYIFLLLILFIVWSNGDSYDETLQGFLLYPVLSYSLIHEHAVHATLTQKKLHREIIEATEVISEYLVLRSKI